MMKLVAISEFGNSKIGSEITDSDAITDIEDSTLASYVVRVGSSSPIVFTANDSTSIVTLPHADVVNTTLGSTNDGAPVIGTGPSPAPIPYAMATGRVSAGSINIQMPQDVSYVMAIFHDGSLTESQMLDVFSGTHSPTGVGLVFGAFVNGGVGSAVAKFPVNSSVSGSLTDPTQTTLTLNAGMLTTDIGSFAIDTSQYSYISLVITAPVDRSTTVIDTLTFTNNLTF